MLAGDEPGRSIGASASRILAAAEKRAEQAHAQAVADGDAEAAFVHDELRGLFSGARALALGPLPRQAEPDGDGGGSPLVRDHLGDEDDRCFADLRAALRDDRRLFADAEAPGAEAPGAEAPDAEAPDAEAR